MNIYLINDNDIIGGINTWNKNFLKLFKFYNLEIELIEIDYILENINNIENKIIIFNNIKNLDILNEEKLLTLTRKNKNYYVFHATLCPINKVFLKFSKYFYGIISISKEVFVKLNDMYSDKHIVYIPNKIIFDGKILDIKENKDVINFGYVGRISKEKNINLIIDSFNEFLYYNSNALLHIFGNTDTNHYYPLLKNIISQLKLEEKIIFHGIVTDKDQIYNKIDYLLVSSISEGIPFCIIEASYYNVPVISSNVGSIKEIINSDNGFLFNIEGFNYTFNNKFFLGDYDHLLSKCGYTFWLKGNDYDINDTKPHVCRRKILNINPNLKATMIPSIYCNTYSKICSSCQNLLIKKHIYQNNIQNMSNKMIYATKTKINVYKIYENLDIKENLLNLINSNKMYIKYDFSTDYIKYLYIINTDYNYGICFTYNFKPLFYNIEIEYEKKGICYFYVKNTSTEKFISLKLLDDNNKKLFNFNFKRHESLKFGLRISDEETDAYIKIKSIKLKILNNQININNFYYISRFDFDIIDILRFNQKKDINKILFLIISNNFNEKNNFIENINKNLNCVSFKNNNLNYLISVGSKNDKVKYDNKEKILYIDKEDIYENQSYKIINTLEWIYNNTEFEYIYRFDETFKKLILNLIPNEYEKYDYYGNSIIKSLIRNIHFGECKNNELNKKLNNDNFVSDYANRNFGYMLSKKFLKILIDNKKLIEKNLLEDKIIGDILFKNNIILNKKN